MAEQTGEEDEVMIEEVPREEKASGSSAAEPSETEEAEDSRKPVDKALDKIEEEKKKMSPLEKLERSMLWKVEGNGFFKSGDLFKAADCYYHAIIFARDLTQNPQHYPDMKHTQEDRAKAKEICESVFTNLGLVQLKYAATMDPKTDYDERVKVLKEASKSSSEALKLNPKNVKALFRRASATAALAKDEKSNEEAQKLCAEAKADLMQVIEADAQNREARAELKAVQDLFKQLKKEEREGEKKEFSFASTLSAFAAKEKDLLGDGSIRKQISTDGDGGKWLNEDWLHWDAATKCVVHVSFKLIGGGSDASDALVNLSFILGDPEMHEGMTIAVKSMTKGEVAKFTFAQHRLSSTGSLAQLLPAAKVEAESSWEITFQKFVTWDDIDKNGDRLVKIQSEGYGAEAAEDLSEVFAHWRVFGPDGKLVHSSRYTVSLSEGTGMKQVEDEDKDAPSYVIGEGAWEPISTLCRRMKQGGVGELRLRTVPELPKAATSGGTDDVQAKLSMMLNGGGKAGKAANLRHCVIKVELERVVPPVAGPGDERWEGSTAVVQERFRGEQLLEQGDEKAALVRLRRVVAWVDQLPASEATSLGKEAAAARSSIGWVLVDRAAPILDSGSVSSGILKVAKMDLAEAEGHCAWLEANHSSLAGTHLLRAKILVAQDDDFAAAHEHLLEAQRIAPEDKRVQEELRTVKAELRNVLEQQSRAKVVQIRDGLQRARAEGSEVLPLLKQLSETRCSWETIMDTKIGVELKNCQDCSEEAKQLCLKILGRLKDESKEQRPMWEN